MLAGLLGSIGYMGYFAKNESIALLADSIIKPTNSLSEDKKIIQQNFKLICKRALNVKLDNGLPIYEKHYGICMAYLKDQGFSEEAVDYFKILYTNKYNMRRKILTKKINDKHEKLAIDFANQENKKIMIYKQYFGGNKEKTDKMMENDFWKSFANHYSLLRDGPYCREVWNLSVPEYIKKKDIDKIYDEVCFLQGIYKDDAGLKIQKI